MNELYAADPNCCVSASDLKLLLNSFGPYTGRYLANYPSDWIQRILTQSDALDVLEAARIKTLLRRAKEDLKIVTRSNLAWTDSVPWLDNATEHMPTPFDALIACESRPPSIFDLDELDLPPTAEERVLGVAREYVRVTRILALLSPELWLIDPYLNPLKRAYSQVLAPLFDLFAKGKSQKVILWSRASEVYRSANQASVDRDLYESLKKLVASSGFKPGRQVEMILVEDETSKSKMHGRHLFSIKGGVRLDQGFQQLPTGRKVDVGPAGKAIHSELWDIYCNGHHDMTVKTQIMVTA
jgi:hypothetical protein